VAHISKAEIAPSKGAVREVSVAVTPQAIDRPICLSTKYRPAKLITCAPFRQHHANAAVKGKCNGY